VDCNFRFLGQYFDEETQLHYNRHRYFSPETGQYISADPIGLAGGFSPYSYVHNPARFVDPLGLSGTSGTKVKRPSDDLGTVTGHYSAVKPGPLDDALAETFAGGRYKEVILDHDIVMHRAGVSTNEYGRFFSLDKPQSVLQTRIDKAVLPKWPNGGESPLDTVYTFTVPKGTKVYVGDVGVQKGFYLGGTEQIVIPAPWNVPGMKVIGKGMLP
jgi:RHS repeat-associated protein